MTQWDMVTVIIALVGLIFTVVKPLLTLNKTITTLNINMERMNLELTEVSTKNSASHKRLWDHNVEQDDRLDDHESRIVKIEEK